MKLYKFPCEVQAGTVSKVGSNVRIDLTDFLEGKPINCAASALKVGLLFNSVSEHDGSTLVMIDHEAKLFETSRLAPDEAKSRLSLLCALQPYAVLMGWTGFSRTNRLGGLVKEGRATIEGHPCDQLLAGDPTEGWTRYYAARDLDGLVIQIEWGSPHKGGGGEGLIAMFPPSGKVTLTNVTLEPREITLDPPAGYKKERVRKALPN
jgi:hypothetical protein